MGMKSEVWRIRRGAAVAACLVAGIAAAVLPMPAGATETGPPVLRQGAVSFVSGGIGAPEAALMKDLAGRYPLELLFVMLDENGHGAYLAGSRVEIRDGTARTVLATTSEGPFLLVNLPPGRYTVRAEHDGQALTRTLAVTVDGHQRAVFAWPGVRPPPTR